MGLFGGLKDFFGGGKTKSKTDVQRVDWWNPEQQQMFKSLFDQFNKQGFGPSSRAPQMWLPRTQEEENYFNMSRSQAVQNMAQGIVPYEVGPEYARQYWKRGMEPIYDRAWKKDINPAIQEQYAGSTFNSTGRDTAVTEAATDFGLEKARSKQELIYGEELAKRQAIENAYGRIATGQQLSGEAAKYSREIGQEQLMDQLQRYLMGEEVDGQSNMAYNPMVTMAFNLLGLQPWGYSGVNRSEGQGPGLGYGLFSGMAGGLGKLFGGMW